MSETEPTDPLAELRRLVNTATLGKPLPDDEEHTDYIAAFERMADVADRGLRYLTSPEAPEEVAREIAEHCGGSYVDDEDRELARAILRFIAEKAVTR